jgi:hypothetical protein
MKRDIEMDCEEMEDPKRRRVEAQLNVAGFFDASPFNGNKVNVMKRAIEPFDFTSLKGTASRPSLIRTRLTHMLDLLHWVFFSFRGSIIEVRS